MSRALWQRKLQQPSFPLNKHKSYDRQLGANRTSAFLHFSAIDGRLWETPRCYGAVSKKKLSRFLSAIPTRRITITGKNERRIRGRSVNERIFHIGESLERNNIRARRHKCKIKPERLRLRRSSESRFSRAEPRVNRLARDRGKTYREPLSVETEEDTAPAYPHFLDNEQIARRRRQRRRLDPHLTAWFPAIDRPDRLITRHVAPSIETEVIDERDHGAHTSDRRLTISFLRLCCVIQSVSMTPDREKCVWLTPLADW